MAVGVINGEIARKPGYPFPQSSHASNTSNTSRSRMMNATKLKNQRMLTCNLRSITGLKLLLNKRN
jgi:hypothetical protein